MGVSGFNYILGDCLQSLKSLEDNTIDCCVTSPPYWGLRDYGVEGQLGSEPTPFEFVDNLVRVFREVRRTLKDNGTLWLNLGDSYCGGGNNRGNNSPLSDKQSSSKGAVGQSAKFGSYKFKSETIKPKDLIGIPWRVAFALQADGWYLRQDIIWHKPNPMPESVKDRFTKSHEYLFLFSKNKKYYFDQNSILEDAISSSEYKHRSNFSIHSGKSWQGEGKSTRRFKESKDGKIKRNKRSVWTVSPKPLKEAHFATFPPDLVTPCILAGCPVGGIVLDPFMGSGTTGLVALKNKRNFLGIELNQDYVKIAEKRMSVETL